MSNACITHYAIYTDADGYKNLGTIQENLTTKERIFEFNGHIIEIGKVSPIVKAEKGYYFTVRVETENVPRHEFIENLLYDNLQYGYRHRFVYDKRCGWGLLSICLVYQCIY